MNPGATTRLVASIVVEAVALPMAPTKTICPFVMPTSPRNQGAPLPSTMRPLRINTSNCGRGPGILHEYAVIMTSTRAARKQYLAECMRDILTDKPSSLAELQMRAYDAAMKRSVLVFAMGLAMSVVAFGQDAMQRELRGKFESDLKTIQDNFHGVLGAEFVDLTDGAKVSLNADAVFPSASTIKVAILLELFRQADQRPELLKQQRPFVADPQTAGTGIARLISPSSSLSVEDIAKIMINMSENTATNLIIDE